MSLIAVACALFGIGLLGVLVRRDIIALLASVEVMLGGALVLLVGLGASVRHAEPAVSVEGVALIVIVVAAAEAAVGLALLVAVARRRRTTRDRRPDRGEAADERARGSPLARRRRADRARRARRSLGRFAKRCVPWVAMLGPLLVLAIGIGALVRSRRAEAAAAEPWTSALASAGSSVWFGVGALTITVGWALDTLAALMLLVVGVVALMVMVFSIGYMAEDPGRVRYFALLSAFTGSMTLLVIGDSFTTLFIGWELVGACSYLLIGFWYQKPLGDEGRGQGVPDHARRRRGPALRPGGAVGGDRVARLHAA